MRPVYKEGDTLRALTRGQRWGRRRRPDKSWGPWQAYAARGIRAVQRIPHHNKITQFGTPKHGDTMEEGAILRREPDHE